MSNVRENPSANLDKSSERVRRMFGSIAGRYDLMNHVAFAGHRSLLAAANGAACPAEGRRRPDIGCLHRHGRSGLGLLEGQRQDRSDQWLPTSASRCSRWPSRRPSRAGAENNITWQEADTQQLPFADDTFQIVCVAFGLRNVSDTDRGLTEMVRVCRRGGAWLFWSSPCPRSGRFPPFTASTFATSCHGSARRWRKTTSRLIIIFRRAFLSSHKARNWPRGCGPPGCRTWSFTRSHWESPRCTWEPSRVGPDRTAMQAHQELLSTGNGGPSLA